ncbi:hypothetical protein ABZR13_16045 [Pseudomonas aeruginosa]
MQQDVVQPLAQVFAPAHLPDLFVQIGLDGFFGDLVEVAKHVAGHLEQQFPAQFLAVPGQFQIALPDLANADAECTHQRLEGHSLVCPAPPVAGKNLARLGGQAGATEQGFAPEFHGADQELVDAFTGLCGEVPVTLHVQQFRMNPSAYPLRVFGKFRSDRSQSITHRRNRSDHFFLDI